MRTTLSSMMILTFLAMAGQSARAEVPIQVVTAINGRFSCALGSEGHVRCWGQNNFGQAGYPVNEPIVRAGAGRPPLDLGYEAHGRALQLALGNSHACAIMEDNAVLCWGRNDGGQLGRGGVSTYGSVTKDMAPVNLGKKSGRVISLAAGVVHTCALFDSGAVKCWGLNRENYLGLKGDSRVSTGQLGDSLPEIDFGGARILQLSAGSFHTCALTEYRTVRCWGANGEQQLGVGEDGYNYHKHKPRLKVPPGTTTDDLDLGLVSGEIVLNVQAGNLHSCALIGTEGGPAEKIKCWGNNNGGALGIGSPERGRYGQRVYKSTVDTKEVLLGLEPGDSIRSLSLGDERSCALLQSGRVKCWGMNSDGELGIGDKNNRGTDPKEMGEKLPYLNLAPGLSAESLSYRSSYGCAIISTTHAVKCWGANDSYQLGLSDRLSRGKTPDEMGNELPYVDLSF